MPDHYDVIRTLTSEVLRSDERQDLLRTFASGLGWEPSDELELPHTGSFSSAHLVVEHGLRNTAVISFLRDDGYPALTSADRQTLLGVSYNNLVDWHLAIDREGVSYVFNRARPPEFYHRRERFSRLQTGPLASSSFEQIAERRPTANLPALDDALIRTISDWKRDLAANVPRMATEAASALFNAIIFTRAVEDYRRRGRGNSMAPYTDMLTRARQATRASNGRASVRELIESSLSQLGVNNGSSPIELDLLDTFAALDTRTLIRLLGDFYENRYASYYNYDFSVMSRHALSRIYEHYVSLLRPAEEDDQFSLLPDLPEEELQRTQGNVYTPEFIARFFAKYATRHTGRSEALLTALDPACGSGLFLRTLLEHQYATATVDRSADGDTMGSLMDTQVVGLDIDRNACHATRLSLALLNLAMTGRVAQIGRVLTLDALSAESPDGVLDTATYNIVFANPPYIAFDNQDLPTRARVAATLGDAAVKRPDTYLAFLALALRVLKPGGLGLFVLPQTFVLNESAAPLRRRMSHETWIRCLVDLSRVRVFEDVGVYPVLLVFQKRVESQPAPRAVLARCRDAVGLALEQVLRSLPSKTQAFDVFHVSQKEFSRSDWRVLPPAEASLSSSLSRLPTLEAFFEVRQGLSTGADDVFVRPASVIPATELELYRPLLTDRDMEPYRVTSEINSRVFHPFINDRVITEDELRERFPSTWAYLSDYRPKLSGRKAVLSGDTSWWKPTRPRLPRRMFRPKVVTPHLVILPQFAYDAIGEFAVSHGPYLYPRESTPRSEVDTLCKYVTAVLNSSVGFWHIYTHARRYGGRTRSIEGERSGYALLEVKELKDTPIPDPTLVALHDIRTLVDLVDQRRIAGDSDALALEARIDALVTHLYDLSPSDLEALGITSIPQGDGTSRRWA